MIATDNTSKASSKKPKTFFRMSERVYRHADDNSEGRCLSCHDTAYGVEPDAREYVCESCGEATVYGMQELLIMGRIVIRGGR
jgi:nitrate/TMAO reductase-like tetraheme cytochrome c subunit